MRERDRDRERERLYIYKHIMSSVTNSPARLFMKSRPPRLMVLFGSAERDLRGNSNFREFRTQWRVPTWPKPENCRLLALNHFQDYLNS